MSAVEHRTSPSRTTLRYVALAGFAAVLIGATLIARGPDDTQIPPLETATVTFSDGHSAHVQMREVTVAQWQDCYRAKGCALNLSGNVRDTDYPATGLSYPDAAQYIDWLNTQSGLHWRLPTAAEWQELAIEVMPEKPDPIFTDPALTWASTYLTEANRTSRALRPSGAFSATSAGIEDLDGNVWEWTQDCYAGASGQGESIDPARCPAFIMGGEHEAVMSYLIRDPARGGCAVGTPPAHLGMRLVADQSE
ncbi:MAG: SUMF1/EgtB/PvdO family nonheme iron enzyme [Planktotalea sp.]|uniref:formylglycine-generating enzyme family protein n=1 Tax=Planktotalea sp. TaxID=2029877 RepID=UPI003C77EF66